MGLNFTKNGEWYVAEFEATKDFNVHIEKKAGDIKFYQKTAGGEYDYVSGIGYLGNMTVFDTDFTALVYPKSIRIKSKALPTVAVVTFAE